MRGLYRGILLVFMAWISAGMTFEIWSTAQGLQSPFGLGWMVLAGATFLLLLDHYRST